MPLHPLQDYVPTSCIRTRVAVLPTEISESCLILFVTCWASDCDVFRYAISHLPIKFASASALDRVEFALTVDSTFEGHGVIGVQPRQHARAPRAQGGAPRAGAAPTRPYSRAFASRAQTLMRGPATARAISLSRLAAASPANLHSMHNDRAMQHVRCT